MAQHLRRPVATILAISRKSYFHAAWIFASTEDKAFKFMTNNSANNKNTGISEVEFGFGARPHCGKERIMERSKADILSKLAQFGLAVGVTFALSACVTPREQRAMDQGQCYDFGYEPRSEAFADCMMGLSQQRADIQASRNLQLQAQLAEQNHRRDMRQDDYKALSLQRSGDKNYPVCGASSDGGMDRRTMTWFGPNCRAR